MEIKLRKEDAEMFKRWEKDYNAILGAVNNLVNESVANRLLAMARTMGIDAMNGKWNFNREKMAFISPDAVDPKLEIPKKRGRKPKDKSVIEAEVVKE